MDLSVHLGTHPSTGVVATRSLLVLAVIAGISCGEVVATPDPVAPGHRVLFVGNSLTYVNDLPATVGAIAASAGDTMTISTAAGPNLALIDHLTGATNAVQLIRDSTWDYVVLQQGPTPSGICRDSLVLWTQMFDSHIRAAHGHAALFMTWPRTSRGDIWTDVRTSFQLAAQAVNGVFLPAGEAWHIALTDHPGLPLYGDDGYHPSPMGSFLAALEIYERLSGRDARTLPAQAFAAGSPMSMSADTIRWLQTAAHAANVNFPAFGNVPAGQSSADHRPAGSTTC
jgi:hypothetical protein